MESAFIALLLFGLFSFFATITANMAIMGYEQWLEIKKKMEKGIL